MQNYGKKCDSRVFWILATNFFAFCGFLWCVRKGIQCDIFCFCGNCDELQKSYEPKNSRVILENFLLHTKYMIWKKQKNHVGTF